MNTLLKMLQSVEKLSKVKRKKFLSYDDFFDSDSKIQVSIKMVCVNNGAIWGVVRSEPSNSHSFEAVDIMGPIMITDIGVNQIEIILTFTRRFFTHDPLTLALYGVDEPIAMSIDDLIVQIPVDFTDNDMQKLSDKFVKITDLVDSFYIDNEEYKNNFLEIFKCGECAP